MSNSPIRQSFKSEGIPWAHEPRNWPQSLSPLLGSYIPGFISALDEFERNTLHQGYEYLRVFRQHVMPNTQDQSQPPPVDTVFASFYSLLMAYRLFDILSAQSSAPTDWLKESDLDRGIDLGEIVTTLLPLVLSSLLIKQQKMERHLENWVDRLSTIRNLLHDSGDANPDFHSDAVPLYLYKYVCRAGYRMDLARTMHNIGIAALHLHHVLKGSLTIENIGQLTEGQAAK